MSWNCKCEKKYFCTSVSDITKKAVARVSRTDVIIVDLINCQVVQALELDDDYDKDEKFSFQFSPGGNKVFVFGKRKGMPEEYFCTQHIIVRETTLKAVAIRKIRETWSINQLKGLNIPKTLRHELTFGYI